MKQKTKLIFGIVGTIILGLILAIVGLFVGSILGGNGIININFLGLVGYESAGMLFLIVGGILEIIIGAISTYFIAKKK